MVERLRSELPAGVEPTAEPLGWVCSSCGGRFGLTDIRQVAGTVDLLLDAADTHRC